MNSIVVCAVFLAICAFVGAFPAPQHQGVEEKGHVIPILKNEFENNHDGYKYSYITGNGIHVDEEAHILNRGDKDHESIVKKGSFVYLDEHGHSITLNYIADDTGFHPEGEHLPHPPPQEVPLPYHREQEFNEYPPQQPQHGLRQ